MSIRCVKCAYRDEGRVGTPGHPGCAYLQITGRSRLRAVYEALGVHELTDAVREAMKPEHCPMYRHGDKRELTETRILLGGSTPERAGDPKRKLDERAALALYKQGKYDKEIARELGVCAATVSKWRNALGLPQHLQRTDRRREVRALYEKGLTDREIQEALGIRNSTVVKWRRSWSLPPNKKRGADCRDRESGG